MNVLTHRRSWNLVVDARVLEMARTAQISKVLGTLAVNKGPARVCFYCSIDSGTQLTLRTKTVHSCNGGYKVGSDGQSCTAL
jgi:hypothetical protein